MRYSTYWTLPTKTWLLEKLQMRIGQIRKNCTHRVLKHEGNADKRHEITFAYIVIHRSFCTRRRSCNTLLCKLELNWKSYILKMNLSSTVPDVPLVIL